VAAVPSDIIVVGAGVIGCSVAYELARRGASVQIVDDRPAGMGATQASAGVLAPYIEAREEGPLLELTIRSLDLFDNFIARVSTVSGIEVPYRRTGTLDVAMQEETMARFAATLDALRGRGVAAELLDRQGARAMEPGLAEGIHGALWIATHGYVAAGELTRALVAAGRRHGAQMVQHGRARRIAKAGTDLVVETTRGSLTANAVVLAAGSWCGEVEIEGTSHRAPVHPVRGQLLHLGWFGGAALQRVTWTERCYLVPWDDGTLLVGATVENAGFDERATAAGVRDLLEAACELVPRVWTASFTCAKVGLRPASDDGLPIVGPYGVLPNLWYATGHYRNGVLLAPLTAQLVADAMLEHQHDAALDLMRPQRFGPL
jgi:glycine oxidase